MLTYHLDPDESYWNCIKCWPHIHKVLRNSHVINGERKRRKKLHDTQTRFFLKFYVWTSVNLILIYFVTHTHIHSHHDRVNKAKVKDFIFIKVPTFAVVLFGKEWQKKEKILSNNNITKSNKIKCIYRNEKSFLIQAHVAWCL